MIFFNVANCFLTGLRKKFNISESPYCFLNAYLSSLEIYNCCIHAINFSFIRKRNSSFFMVFIYINWLTGDVLLRIGDFDVIIDLFYVKFLEMLFHHFFSLFMSFDMVNFSCLIIFICCLQISFVLCYKLKKIKIN